MKIRRALSALDTLVYSVPGRVFLVTLAVLVVTSQLVLNVLFTGKTFRDVIRPWIEVTADLAQKTIEVTMLRNGVHTVPDELAGIRSRSARIARIDVTDAKRIVRFSTDPAAVGERSALLARAAAFREKGSDVEPVPLEDDSDQRIVVRSFHLAPECVRCHHAPAGTHVGHLVLLFDTGGATALTQETVRSTLRVVVIVVLLLAVFLGIYVHRAFVQPVRRLAAHMGESTDPVPVSEDGLPKELREIAQGYNQGVERLTAARGEVERLQKDRLVHIERLAILGQLSASMAHEIRSPLAGITSAVRILAEEMPIPEDKRLIVTEIHAQSQRLCRTLADFLSYARPRDPSPTRLGASQIVARAVHLMGPALDRKGIRLETHVQPNAPDVFADEECIVQVLLNLLLNADQALSGPGTIRVEVASDPDSQGHAIVRVIDDGPGMPPEVLKRVGEPFFTTKAAGTGLGLAISRELVEQMHGQLTIESSPGAGTTVSMRLPACQGPRSAPEGKAGSGIIPLTAKAATLALLRLAAPVWAAPPAGDAPCLGCHKKLVTPAHVHPALDDGCGMCHEAAGEPVTGKHKKGAFKPVRALASLCGDCHEAVAGFATRAGPHDPAASASCTECHDPHASAQAKLLKKPVPSLCFECHDKPSPKHGHGPAAAGECLACHDPHGGVVKPALRVAQPDLCFGCHDDVKKRFTAAVVHAPARDACTRCHGPHGGPTPRFLAAEGEKLCRKCHEPLLDRVAKATERHDALDEGCETCHDPHASEQPRLLKEKPVALCGTCHDEIAGLAESMPSAHLVKEGCPRCHDPHGSSNLPLLKAAFPARKLYQPFSLESYALCFGCHDKSLVDPAAQPPGTAFRDGAKNLHAVHVAKSDKGRTCSVCHSVHGSPQPRLIRRELAFGGAGWKLTIDFKPSVDGGTCVASCHEPKTYRRDKP